MGIIYAHCKQHVATIENEVDPFLKINKYWRQYRQFGTAPFMSLSHTSYKSVRLIANGIGNHHIKFP